MLMFLFDINMDLETREEDSLFAIRFQGGRIFGNCRFGFIGVDIGVGMQVLICGELGMDLDAE